MKLPEAERAVVDIAKLRDYCLSPFHPRGRHKAASSRACFGLMRTDAEFLRQQLIRAARVVDAIESESDEYGKRYIVDFELFGTIGDDPFAAHGSFVEARNFRG